jgi:hypothetical protein
MTEEPMAGQMTFFDQDTWFGKMCAEHSVPTKARTSESCLKKQRGSQTKMPLFLDLRKGRSGLTQDVSWVTGGALLGEYTMHGFGECPKEENVSLLSQILEDHPHPKYCLSEKACQGMLNRADRRGKKLPDRLREALEQQIIRSRLGGREVDSAGKRAGKGPLIQKELSGTLGVSQDQTLFQADAVCIGNGQANSQVSDIVGALNCMHDQQAVVYGISPYDSNAMKSSNPNSGIYEADTARTLDNNGGSPACNQGGMLVLDKHNMSVNEDKTQTLIQGEKNIE